MKADRPLFDAVDSQAESMAGSRADADVMAGRTISHGAVMRWLKSWSGGEPLPRPRVGD